MINLTEKEMIYLTKCVTNKTKYLEIAKNKSQVNQEEINNIITKLNFYQKVFDFIDKECKNIDGN